MARELHDVVTSAVSGMMLQAAVARSCVRPDQPRLVEILALIESTAAEALREMYEVLRLLRAGSGGGSGRTGPTLGLRDLPRLVSRSRAVGLDVSLVVDGSPRLLDSEVELTGYRVAQEGLSNALRHAGTGAAVQIRVAWRLDCVEVSVRDHRAADRRATLDVAATISGGFGWQGLAERVRSVNGRLTREVMADGFEVVAELPYAVGRA
jgi:signal transduction histidine kinase